MNRAPLTAKTVVLKSGRDRSVINRHPWIFSGAVKSAPPADDGEIVAVSDNRGQRLGWGFWSTNSQIQVRMFDWADGTPTFDADYWAAKVRRAWELRRRFVNQEGTDAYRLLHAEGDFLPGVIVDVYGEVAVAQLLTKGSERIQPHLRSALRELGWPRVYLKNKEAARRLEGVGLPNGWLGEEADAPAPPVHIRESGLRFAVDHAGGQKTGFFLDQRENRRLLMQYAADKRVLNAFSYTAGFSVYAVAGGATAVHSVDISKEAVRQGEANVALNFGEEAPHRSTAADCFDYLKATTETYDLIVLDPPAFAKHARAVPNATRGYMEINLWAFRKVAPGGVVFTFSCSQNVDRDLFRKVVFGAAADAGRNVRILHQLSQPADHPVNIYHPEGEYLKGLVLYVE
ncbi:MAG: class I SAM-dependent rRNA methyltransferase [Catalinimonas sp.]